MGSSQRLHDRILAPDGLRIICAGLDNAVVEAGSPDFLIWCKSGEVHNGICDMIGLDIQLEVHGLPCIIT